eukprot:UN12871
MMIAIDRYQGATKPLSHFSQQDFKEGHGNDWDCMAHFIHHLGHSNCQLEIYF